MRLFKFAYFRVPIISNLYYIFRLMWIGGHAVAQLVEALRYKPEGRELRFPMVSLEFFIDIILPAALWLWRLTQPLTEMSTRNISWEVKAAGAYN